MFYIVTVILVILLVIDMIYENKHFKVEHYDIIDEKIPTEFNGSKFVVLADLHSNQFGKDNDILIKAIDEIHPDFILVAGDMLVGDNHYDDTVAYSLLKRLASNYKIYYGFGNHERRISKPGKHYHQELYPFMKKLEKLGVVFLTNRSIDLIKGEKSITISGLDMDYKYYKRGNKLAFEADYMKKNIGKCNKECYNILIGHNPIYFDEYVEWGANLVVSGHIHGGLVRLPFGQGMVSPQYRLFPKYDSGRFIKDKSTMLVSRGLGMHTLKIRVNNLPELMVVHLKSNDRKGI